MSATAELAATVTSFKAAQEWHCAVSTLRALVNSGEVSCVERRPYHRGECIVFDRATLEAEIAALGTCRAPGCSAPALCRGRLCSRHAKAAASAARSESRVPAVEDRDWRTVEEAMKAKGCPRTVIDHARAKGELASERVDGIVRINAASLTAWTPPSSHLRSDAQREKHHELVKLLHQRGDTAPRIATVLDVSLPTVHSHLEQLGLKPRRRRRRQPSAEQRAAREERIRAKYTAGRPRCEIEAEEECSAPVIYAAVKRAGLSLRPSGKPAKYPPVQARDCPGCGEPFTPRWPAAGAQRYCTTACFQSARAKAARRLADERGLLLTGDLVKRWCIGLQRVENYISTGRLAAEQIKLEGFPGRPVYGVLLDEADRFEREWARGGDRRRTCFLDPELALAHKKATGWFDKQQAATTLGREALEAIVRDQVQRRANLYARRRRGRRRAPHRERWRERLVAIAQEQRETYELDVNLGLAPGPRPSRRTAAAALFQEDWKDCPGTWPRDAYPARDRDGKTPDPKMNRKAVERILDTVESRQHTGKVLQKPPA